jgi:signal transduction histidine kinase
MKISKKDENISDCAFHVVENHLSGGGAAGALATGRNVICKKTAQGYLEESRQLAARNDSAREEELKHLSREIHDELGQRLSALRMGVSVIGMRCKQDEALQAMIQPMITLVDSTILMVRNLVASLRPSALDMGIVPALEYLIDEFNDTHPEVQCTLHATEDEIDLDEKRATEIFRIVQESLTNIGRHAQASKAEVALKGTASHYVLEVLDNGIGFDPSLQKKQSFGLIGIRERVLMLNGELEISSLTNQRTKIKVVIPRNAAPGKS